MGRLLSDCLGGSKGGTYADDVACGCILLPPLARTRLSRRLGLLRPGDGEAGNGVDDLNSGHEGEGSPQRRDGVLDEGG